MGKESQPASPNYTQAAQEQGQESQELATQQTYANRPDVSTPWGDLSYTQQAGIDPANGQSVTDWGENVSLTPQEQQALDSQQSIQGNNSALAQSLQGEVAGDISKSPQQTPQMQGLSGAGQGIDYNPEMLDQNTTNAVWNQFQNMEEPLQQQQTQAQDSQLANQGLKPGDAAFNTANTNLQNTQFNQDQTAADQALLAGEQEGSTLFGERNSAQAQGYGQDVTQGEYNNSLIGGNLANEISNLGLNEEQAGYGVNLMNGLLNGEQVGMPSFPGTSSASSGQATNYLGAAQDQGQADLNDYNANVSNSNSMLSGLGSLAGGLLSFL